MTNQTLQPPAQSRLRRWWGYFYATLEAAESSSYGYMADSFENLETRVRRLEEKLAPSKDE